MQPEGEVIPTQRRNIVTSTLGKSHRPFLLLSRHSFIALLLSWHSQVPLDAFASKDLSQTDTAAVGRDKEGREGEETPGKFVTAPKELCELPLPHVQEGKFCICEVSDQ